MKTKTHPFKRLQWIFLICTAIYFTGHVVAACVADPVKRTAALIVNQYEPSTAEELETATNDYLGANWNERTPAADNIIKDLGQDPETMEADDFYFLQLEIHNTALNLINN